MLLNCCSFYCMVDNFFARSYHFIGKKWNLEDDLVNLDISFEYLEIVGTLLWKRYAWRFKSHYYGIFQGLWFWILQRSYSGLFLEEFLWRATWSFSEKKKRTSPELWTSNTQQMFAWGKPLWQSLNFPKMLSNNFN